MGEAVSELGRRTVAVAIVLAAAWLALKFVIGAVTAVAWLGVAILALVAVVWAVRAL
ncbi:MAG: hypothetical protein WKF40_10585 [Thermoleophilaceae bacterium]